MNFNSQFSKSQRFNSVSQYIRLTRFEGLLLMVAMLPLQNVWAQNSIEELPAPVGIDSRVSASDPTVEGTKSILEQTSSASSSDPAGMQSVLEQNVASDRPQPGDVPPPPMPMKEWATNPDDGVNNGRQDRQAPDNGLEYEVLMQGPLHEAFAIPEQLDSFPNPVIPKAPPAPIDEQQPTLPAAEGMATPATKNLQWIGGYWAFSEEVGDYVWVSGLYREVPPDRVWVPGIWMETDGGYQRVQGYWESIALAEQTVFLPPPPASIDNGPSSPPPNDHSFWMPGQWNYVGNDYQWQAGYWTAQYAEWVWQPACYQSTPQGYIYVSGYWDYEPIHRGVVYAPVVFRKPVYLTPGYRYRPGNPMVNPSSLLMHLFVRSGHRHYYYGDFYGDRYARLGYQPWYRSSLPAFHTASLLSHYQWKYQRQGIAFVDSMARYDNYFRSNPIAQSSLASTLPTLRITSNAMPPTSPFGSSFDAIVRSSVVGSPVRVNPSRVVAGSVAGSSASVLNRVSPTQDALRSLSRTAVPNLALPGGQRQDNAFSYRNAAGVGNTTIDRVDALGRRVQVDSGTGRQLSSGGVRVPSSSYGANPTISSSSLSPGRNLSRTYGSSPANLVPQGFPRAASGPTVRDPRTGFSTLPPSLNSRSGSPLASPRGFSPPSFGPPGFSRADAASRLRSSMPSFSPPGFSPPSFPNPGMGRSTIGPPVFSPRASNPRSGGLGQGGPGFGAQGFGAQGLGGAGASRPAFGGRRK